VQITRSAARVPARSRSPARARRKRARPWETPDVPNPHLGSARRAHRVGVRRRARARDAAARVFRDPAARAGRGVRAGRPAGPLVAGTASYVDGTYAWTDYAYDDTGAPYAQGSSNAADLIQLQLRFDDAGDLVVRAILETLTGAAAPALSIALDSDADASTGGLTASPVNAQGVDRWISIAADSATVAGAATGTFGASVDAATNVVSATIPCAVLACAAARWRVYAGLRANSGLAVSDLAFVGGEAPSGWQDARQMQVLAGMLGAENAAATIDLDAMRARTTALADAATPGFHTYLYRSALELGEGVRQSTLRGPGGIPLPIGNVYAGPYQPYVVWVPSVPRARPALVTFMHGLGGTHTSNASSVGAGKIAPDAVVAMPLGRGEDGFYLGAGEQDVLDVTDDAVARFGADPDRVVVSGISMGGFGAYRLAILRPDRWSAMVALIGTSNSAQGYFGAVPPSALTQAFSPRAFPSGAGEMIENLANVPLRMVNGQVDPIVNNVFTTWDTTMLTKLGYDYRYWVLMRRQHEVVPAITDCVFTEALSHARALDPARVTFSTEPATYVSDPASGLDLRYDRAYWVSELAARDTSQQKARIDARPIDAPAEPVIGGGTPAAGADENFTHGADLCGPRPGLQTQDAWRSQRVTPAPSELSYGPVPSARNGLAITLANVASARIDLARAHVDARAPVVLDVTGDGTTTLRLDGSFDAPMSITRDGAPFATVEPHDGVVELVADASARHTYVLARA
jgi:hypothetical protein